MIRKIFSLFGYSVTKKKKSVNIDDIIRLRLKRNKHNILLDIGANYGAFSEYNDDLFKKIYFIEPNTDLLDKLKKKFYKNHKYFFCDFATGDKNEIRSFYITNDSHQSLSSLKKQTTEMKENFRNTNVVNKKKIIVKRLDTYFNETKFNYKNFFLKIDTQGNDYETLIGLGNYIKKVKFIKIEMPCTKLYKINYTHWDILNYLKINNFEPVFFENISRKKNGKLIEYDVFFEKK